MNTPNKLTIIRMVLTPIFLAVFLTPAIPHYFLFALLLFSAGALTDFADGRIARKYNQVTIFGKLMDPIADKMLTTAALLAFLHYGLCNVWIVMIVLTREFAVTSVRMVASAQGVVIPANVWGKLKTVSQMVFTILIMLIGELQNSGVIGGGDKLPLLSNTLLWVMAALTVLSGVVYLRQSKDLIDFSK